MDVNSIHKERLLMVKKLEKSLSRTIFFVLVTSFLIMLSAAASANVSMQVMMDDAFSEKKEQKPNTTLKLKRHLSAEERRALLQRQRAKANGTTVSIAPVSNKVVSKGHMTAQQRRDLAELQRKRMEMPQAEPSYSTKSSNGLSMEQRRALAARQREQARMPEMVQRGALSSDGLTIEQREALTARQRKRMEMGPESDNTPQSGNAWRHGSLSIEQRQALAARQRKQLIEQKYRELQAGRNKPDTYLTPSQYNFREQQDRLRGMSAGERLEARQAQHSERLNRVQNKAETIYSYKKNLTLQQKLDLAVRQRAQMAARNQQPVVEVVKSAIVTPPVIEMVKPAVKVEPIAEIIEPALVAVKKVDISEPTTNQAFEDNSGSVLGLIAKAFAGILLGVFFVAMIIVIVKMKARSREKAAAAAPVIPEFIPPQTVTEPEPEPIVEIKEEIAEPVVKEKAPCNKSLEKKTSLYNKYKDDHELMDDFDLAMDFD